MLATLFLSGAPWEILSLSLQASRGHLHCLARGPFLCPQSQPCSIFRSLSFSLSDLCFYHHTKMSKLFWGVYYYFGEVYMTFTFFFTLSFKKNVHKEQGHFCSQKSPLKITAGHHTGQEHSGRHGEPLFTRISATSSLWKQLRMCGWGIPASV